MRDELEAILKEELHKLLLKEMNELNYTQMKMAEMLHMATRSFADIESGKNMCGTLTTVLLLMRLPSADLFLKEIKYKFELIEQYEEVV